MISLFDVPAEGGAEEVVMTTLAAVRTDVEGLYDPDIVKVVVGGRGNGLYFSRAPVPYSDALASAAVTGVEVEWLQHIGMYAYRRTFLARLATLPPTALEKRERLEQLRVLENGYTIRVGVTENRHLGVDTEEDYRQFVAEYRASIREK